MCDTVFRLFFREIMGYLPVGAWQSVAMTCALWRDGVDDYVARGLRDDTLRGVLTTGALRQAKASLCVCEYALSSSCAVYMETAMQQVILHDDGRQIGVTAGLWECAVLVGETLVCVDDGVVRVVGCERAVRFWGDEEKTEVVAVHYEDGMIFLLDANQRVGMVRGDDTIVWCDVEARVDIICPHIVSAGHRRLLINTDEQAVVVVTYDCTALSVACVDVPYVYDGAMCRVSPGLTLFEGVRTVHVAEERDPRQLVHSFRPAHCSTYSMQLRSVGSIVATCVENDHRTTVQLWHVCRAGTTMLRSVPHEFLCRELHLTRAVLYLTDAESRSVTYCLG